MHHIGKEANHWEEQFYLGFDEEKQIEYGVAPEESKRFLGNLRAQIEAAGQRKIAGESGISRRTLTRFMQGKSVRKGILVKLIYASRARSG